MKIGLLAMSGVRVRDAKLMELGLTLPGFVERSRVIASLPSLGLLTLAGMTPERHQVEYVEVAELPVDRDEKLVVRADLDLMAISSFSAQIFEAYRLAEAYETAGVPVVMGGLHVTAVPQEAKQHCTSVAVGEGELVWRDILADAEAGALRPFYGLEGAREFDLAEAPMPAFHLLDMDRYNRVTVQTSRGCPHRCAFCASSVLLTRGYKQKPARKVLAEIDRVLQLWEHPFIELADDNTFVDKAYWKALLPELAKRKIRWFTETDVSVADDPELLRLMREAGCAQVLVGLESPRGGDLAALETKADWKRRQWPRYEQAIRTIQSHGISVNACFILGLDGQGPDAFAAVESFVESSGCHEVQVTIQTPFPGTLLYDRLLAEGRIRHPGAWDRCTLFDVNFQPDLLTVEGLEERFRALVVRLYSEAATRRRRERFRGFLREAARKLEVAA